MSQAAADWLKYFKRLKSFLKIEQFRMSTGQPEGNPNKWGSSGRLSLNAAPKVVIDCCGHQTNIAQSMALPQAFFHGKLKPYLPEYYCLLRFWNMLHLSPWEERGADCFFFKAFTNLIKLFPFLSFYFCPVSCLPLSFLAPTSSVHCLPIILEF